jgi:hypothetical protein
VIDEIIDRRIEQEQLSPESRAAAVAAVTRVMANAVDSGLQFAAVLLVEEATGPIVASVTATSVLISPPESSGSEDAADVSLHRETDGARASADPDDSSGADRTSPTEVRLPTGPAVRIERVVPYAVTESIAQQVYSVQYVVPVDEHGAGIVITGTSPAIRRKDDLDRVFQEIAETLQVDPAP